MIIIILNLICVIISWRLASKFKKWSLLWSLNMFASAFNGAVIFNNLI